MTTTPLTLHAVVCGVCGTSAVVRSTLCLRGLSTDSYLGVAIASASLDFALPEGWIFRDVGSEVYFCCGSCCLNDVAHAGREPAVA